MGCIKIVWADGRTEIGQQQVPRDTRTVGKSTADGIHHTFVRTGAEEDDCQVFEEDVPDEEA